MCAACVCVCMFICVCLSVCCVCGGGGPLCLCAWEEVVLLCECHSVYPLSTQPAGKQDY